MRIAVLKERREHETRVAIAPDIITKLVKDGHAVVVESKAGDAAGYEDDAMQEAGANIAKDAASTLKNADVIFKIQRPLPEEIGLFKAGQTLICHAQALIDADCMKALKAKKIRLFALELLPRITRAQSMDILSSQANMAGYKAVLDALEHYGKAVPMMSTAAGRVNPANIFIMGVGVAGLQAIATAKRLGAVVYATDVRPATKEQVQSLGGKFVAVEDEEFLEAQTAGGYAKEMSAAYKKKQADLIDETLPNMDIVITTALIPGRAAPVLINEAQVKSMKAGSVIVDLAVEAGGNCPLSEFGKVVEKHGVTLIGHANVPARLSHTTSQLFARNLYNFITPMVDKDSKALNPNMEDEIVQGTLVMQAGSIVHKAVMAKDTAKPVAKKKPATRRKATSSKKTSPKGKNDESK